MKKNLSNIHLLYYEVYIDNTEIQTCYSCS